MATGTPYKQAKLAEQWGRDRHRLWHRRTHRCGLALHGGKRVLVLEGHYEAGRFTHTFHRLAPPSVRLAVRPSGSSGKFNATANLDEFLETRFHSRSNRAAVPAGPSLNCDEKPNRLSKAQQVFARSAAAGRAAIGCCGAHPLQVAISIPNVRPLL